MITGARNALRGSSGSAPRLLAEAVLWLDPRRSVAAEQAMVNGGTTGTTLNAAYGSTAGSDTNDPLLLTHTGTNYLYLPGLASNTIACTAPANTASYAAYPLGGGAATTGAAAAGAFTLQTTGSWMRVDLLTAGAVVLASFVASASAQTGYTDAFSVTWTINRAATGRKSALVTRPVVLFGTDDYLEVPDNALLDFDVPDSFTLLMVVRQWGTSPVTGGYMAKKVTPTNATAGWVLRSTTATNTMALFVGDGTVSDSAPITITQGAVSAFFGRRDVAADLISATLNAGAAASNSDATTASLANAEVLRIGRLSAAGTGYQEFEFLGAAVWRRSLSAAEVAEVAAFYA